MTFHSESVKLATVIVVNKSLAGMTISQISLQSQEKSAMRFINLRIFQCTNIS